MLSLPTEIRGEEDRSFDAQDGERRGCSRESSASIVLGYLVGWIEFDLGFGTYLWNWNECSS